jgi:hypothetical protein
MLNEEIPTMELAGSYRDVMSDASGRVTWDSGWRKNVIVLDCRRLLAGFMRGHASTEGIQALLIGAGDPAWDAGLPPRPPPETTWLTDPKPYYVKTNRLDLKYLDPQTGNANDDQTQATRRLQIVATLGPNMPNWPEENLQPPPHPFATLREFGLVGKLNNTPALINVVRHVAIVKDPLSTLVRTIQLVF